MFTYATRLAKKSKKTKYKKNIKTVYLCTSGWKKSKKTKYKKNIYKKCLHTQNRLAKKLQKLEVCPKSTQTAGFGQI